MECAWRVGRTRQPSSGELETAIQYNSGEEVEGRGSTVARSASRSSAAIRLGLPMKTAALGFRLEPDVWGGQLAHAWRDFLPRPYWNLRTC